MSRQDAVKRIKRVIDDMTGGTLDSSIVEYIAERIYVDVMAPSIDDERAKWIGFGFTYDDGRIFH